MKIFFLNFLCGWGSQLIKSVWLILNFLKHSSRKKKTVFFHIESHVGQCDIRQSSVGKCTMIVLLSFRMSEAMPH